MSGPGRGLTGWAAYETERARRGRRAAARRAAAHEVRVTDPSKSVPETRVSVARPSWLAAWTAGDWRREVEARPEERARYLRSFLEAPVGVRELMIRYPAGTVVALREGAICSPLGPFELVDLRGAPPLWASSIGIVMGFMKPNPRRSRREVVFTSWSDPPSRMTTRSPECWVRVEDVGEVLGYLRGYGPDQARENLRELDELLGEAERKAAP